MRMPRNGGVNDCRRLSFNYNIKINCNICVNNKLKTNDLISLRTCLEYTILIIL